MTKNNYSEMSNQELFIEISNLKISIKKISQLIRFNKQPQSVRELEFRTNFLDEFFVEQGIPTPFLCRLYCIEHNIYEHPRCPICGNKVDWRKGIHEFARHCSQDCAYKDETIYEKMKATWNKNLGCEHPWKSSTCRAKMKQTIEQRYKSDCYQRTNRFKQQISDAWNSKSVDELENIKQRRIDTQTKLYGGVGFASLELREHAMETNELRHGSRTYNNPEKHRMTCRKHWGVDNYTQSIEYHKNKKHKFHSDKYLGLTFDSNWEVKVYEFCRDNNIPIEYSPSISYPYKYAGRTWTYHPDFLINGKVYEVKGDQFFRINESSGKEEMFCPYRRDEWTEDEYEWICGKCEAKHQCMLINDVIIFRENDIQNLSVDMFN